MILKYFAAGFFGGMLTLYFAPHNYFNFVNQGQGGDNILAQQQVSEPQGFRVGIQLGHLNQEELPEELVDLNLKNNNEFLRLMREKELSISTNIAKELAGFLQQRGIEVDLLPATVPPRYSAQAFVALHADWSQDKNIRGFKVTGSAFDGSGNSEKLAELIKFSYQKTTGLPWHNYITVSMKKYYAFNYQLFEHAISPGTPGVIIELGFITNKQDYEFLTQNPQKTAQAIAQGILDFLKYINPNNVRPGLNSNKYPILSI